MFILFLTYLIISNALIIKKNKSILFSRIVMIPLVLTSFLAINNIFILPLDKGIGTYGGLFHITSFTQSFNIFIYLITAMILALTSFYLYKVYLNDFASLSNLLRGKFMYNKTKISNKMGEQFKILLDPKTISYFPSFSDPSKGRGLYTIPIQERVIYLYYSSTKKQILCYQKRLSPFSDIYITYKVYEISNNIMIDYINTVAIPSNNTHHPINTFLKRKIGLFLTVKDKIVKALNKPRVLSFYWDYLKGWFLTVKVKIVKALNKPRVLSVNINYIIQVLKQMNKKAINRIFSITWWQIVLIIFFFFFYNNVLSYLISLKNIPLGFYILLIFILTLVLIKVYNKWKSYDKKERWLELGGIILGMIYIRAIILTLIYLFNLVDGSTIFYTIIAKHCYEYCCSDTHWSVSSIYVCPCPPNQNCYPFNSNGEPNIIYKNIPCNGEPNSRVWSCPHQGETSIRTLNYPSNGNVGSLAKWEDACKQQVYKLLDNYENFPNSVCYEVVRADLILPKPKNWDEFIKLVPDIRLDWYYNFKENCVAYSNLPSSRNKPLYLSKTGVQKYDLEYIYLKDLGRYYQGNNRHAIKFFEGISLEKNPSDLKIMSISKINKMCILDAIKEAHYKRNGGW